ncbi:uncharacterized protein LOC121370562 [Gigantopelta aegis]|uniref:uncharacterized protein LOC121370562 n=1 Tax=Gigantopelta aegis TaxID=1735272 RepID=UPI001B88C4D0|nr:uncharacterized protein LOC121370562 [Gigantopelta aegis]
MFSTCFTRRSRTQILCVFILSVTGLLVYSLSKIKSGASTLYQQLGALHREVISQHGDEFDSSHPKRLLFLFTSWTNKKDKSLVYQKTMDTWRTLMPVVQPGLFSNETLIVSKAKESGWRVHSASETTCGGIPTLRSMFLDAARMYADSYLLQGFSNADIIYDKSLLETIGQIVRQVGHTIQTKPVLIVGKRLNMDALKCLSANASDLSDLLSAGKYPPEGSSDFFITNSKFPWKDVPALVVGRIGFGMWIVAFARARGVTLIDVTRTIRAVHMTTRAGNMESSRNPNAMCNHQLLNRLRLAPRSYVCGWTDCAEYYSLYTATGVRIQHRKIPHSCHTCDSSVRRPSKKQPRRGDKKETT